MIWTNPWAWLGLAAIAVPIAVHLIARSVTTALPFPTLRFLRTASVVSVRRRRLTDPWLLLVRIAIVAAAVAALAQPFIAATARPFVHRIVIVDTSASVSEREAGEAAARASEGAGELLVLARADAGAAMREAAAWLAAREGRREVVVISDFQRGALTAESLAALPVAAGVTLTQVATVVTAAPAGMRATWSLTGESTRAAWTNPAPDAAGIEILGGPGSAALVDAIRGAAAATAEAHAGVGRRMLLVLPSAPGLQPLRASAGALDTPWMFDLLRAIDDGGLVASAGIVTREGTAIPAFFLTDGEPARVAAAARRAIPVLADTPIAERETAMMTAGELRALVRQPAPAAPSAHPSRPIGRWLWLAALVLLALETILRRRRPHADEVLAHAA